MNFCMKWYLVPEFLHTHADESFGKRIIWTRIFTFVDHTIYWKIDYKFPNPNKLSALVELNEIKWLRCTTLMMRSLIKRCFYYPIYGKKYALFMRCFYYPIYGKKSALSLRFHKVNHGEGCGKTLSFMASLFLDRQM